MIPAVNTRDRYGAVAVALHWIMALILVALLAMGLYMVRLPDIGFDKVKIQLIVYHKELGILAWSFGREAPSGRLFHTGAGEMMVPSTQASQAIALYLGRDREVILMCRR